MSIQLSARYDITAPDAIAVSLGIEVVHEETQNAVGTWDCIFLAFASFH
jgi:hypothetical protein